MVRMQAGVPHLSSWPSLIMTYLNVGNHYCRYQHQYNQTMQDYGLQTCKIHKAADGVTEYIDHTQVKTKDRVTIPLSEETKKWMPKQKKGEDTVFHELKITSTTVEVVLAEWMEAAGINKHITYHCSRHTAATLLLTLGASIYVVSKILGHKSIKMTEVYAKIVDKTKVETVNLVNGMFNQTKTAGL